jgi:hypothetical protein
MFVDEVEDAVLTSEPWQTADNYSLGTNALDLVEVAFHS